MAGGTPEGTILRSMGGDMAEAIEEKTGYNLRAVTDPEALFIIKALRRTARKMYPDTGEGEDTRIHPHRQIVNDQLNRCEAEFFSITLAEYAAPSDCRELSNTCFRESNSPLIAPCPLNSL